MPTAQTAIDRAARRAAALAGSHARCRHAECAKARHAVRRQLRAPGPDATDAEVEAFIDLLCRRNPMM